MAGLPTYIRIDPIDLAIAATFLRLSGAPFDNRSEIVKAALAAVVEVAKKEYPNIADDILTHEQALDKLESYGIGYSNRGRSKRAILTLLAEEEQQRTIAESIGSSEPRPEELAETEARMKRIAEELFGTNTPDQG